MKRLVFLLCLLAFPVGAQEYRPMSADSSAFARNNLAFDNSSSWNLTGSFGTGINVARLVCTAACYVAIESTGTNALFASAATGVYLPANSEEYFRVSSSATIAVIGASGSGSLIVHEMSR